jgi:hypothetical protein
MKTEPGAKAFGSVSFNLICIFRRQLEQMVRVFQARRFDGGRQWLSPGGFEGKPGTTKQKSPDASTRPGF